MPKLPDSDVAKLHKAFTSNTLRLFAATGNSISTMVKLSSGDVVAIRIMNATRAASIEGGATKKPRRKKDE